MAFTAVITGKPSFFQEWNITPIITGDFWGRGPTSSWEALQTNAVLLPSQHQEHLQVVHLLGIKVQGTWRIIPQLGSSWYITQAHFCSPFSWPWMEGVQNNPNNWGLTRLPWVWKPLKQVLGAHPTSQRLETPGWSSPLWIFSAGKKYGFDEVKLGFFCFLNTETHGLRWRNLVAFVRFSPWKVANNGHSERKHLDLSSKNLHPGSLT